MPNVKVSPFEMKTFKYGALRQSEDPSAVFDFAAHKSDYNKIGDYV